MIICYICCPAFPVLTERKCWTSVCLLMIRSNRPQWYLRFQYSVILWPTSLTTFLMVFTPVMMYRNFLPILGLQISGVVFGSPKSSKGVCVSSGAWRLRRWVAQGPWQQVEWVTSESPSPPSPSHAPYIASTTTTTTIMAREQLNMGDLLPLLETSDLQQLEQIKGLINEHLSTGTERESVFTDF